MFRTKKDVDKHCREVFRNTKTERERNLRCLSIAQQYYNVRDYESAKRYVTLYLSVKDDSSVGHKLLAQCYECFQEKEKALSEYKYSLQLDPKQPELILRVCELLAESSVAVDKKQAKYWQEKGETHFPYHPSIFKLKQKISVLGDGSDANTVESIILDEVKIRPNDPSVHSKLLTFLIENGRIQEAYNEAFTKISSLVPTLQWYQTAVQTCKAYKMQFPNAVNEDFFANYLFILERTLALAVQDVKISRKGIPECMSFIARFDEVLSAARTQNNKSDSFLLVIDHMAGQLCYHMANILYRKVKWDDHIKQDVSQMAAPLLLLSTSESFTVNNYRKQDTAVTRILDQCSRHNTYRISQAGLILLSRCKDTQQKHFLEKIFHFCVGNWKERILEKVYSNSEYKCMRKSSFFANYAAFSNLPMELPKGLTENIQQIVSVTELTQPASLHHLVWLGVQYLINSEKQSICDRLLPLKFRSTSFRSLRYSHDSAASSYAETLSKIDVDAFLYACVYSAESALQQADHSKLTSQMLPADVCQLLVSPENELWWDAALRMANQTVPEDSFNRVRTILQRGIEVIRLMGNNSLPLPLLVLLGRMFVNRAAIEPNGDLASALEARASLYWKAAIPVLNIMIREDVYNYSDKSMFDYMGKVISKSDAVKLLNEGKRFHDMQQIKGNNYADYFFAKGTTSDFSADVISIQPPCDTQATTTVDEKTLSTLLEQNTRIMDRLETLFSKQELFSSNQMQLFEMVSVLAKKIDDFVIDSLTQAVQPLSPQTQAPPAVAAVAPMPSVAPFDPLKCANPLAAPSQLANSYQYPFAAAGIQTNFPMYQPIASIAPPYVAPSYIPPSTLPYSYGNISQTSVAAQQPAAVFDFRSMYDVGGNGFTPSSRSTIEVPKTTSSILAATLKENSQLSGTPLFSPQPAAFTLDSRTTSTKLSSPFLTQKLTSTTTSTNNSPSHSFQIKVPESSSFVQSPSVEILEQYEEDSDDEKTVVEHDPLPNFKPIIPLPDEITVTTGEEDEEVLFESRAKLFRFADKEWKERGIGAFKILKNRETGRVRVLMRREIVHKICANHLLSASMTLTAMVNNNRAWVYCAPDFADEKMVIEKFCVKFGTPEVATEFQIAFDAHKGANESVTSSAHKGANESVTSSAHKGANESVTSPGHKSATESVTSPAKSKGVTPPVQTPGASPVAAATSALNVKKVIITPPSIKLDDSKKSDDDAKAKVGGFTFSGTPIFTQPDKKEQKIEEKPKSMPFSSLLGFNANSGSATGGSLFGTKVVTPPQDSVKADEKDSSSPFSCVQGTVDFSSLRKSSPGSNAFTKSENFKGFAGAGSLVFGASAKKVVPPSSAVSAILKNIDVNEKPSSDPATPSTKDGNESDNENADGEFEPTVEFAPVVPLPDLVEVKTGEEGLDVLFEEHCKLFRYGDSEWKERGIGKFKILRDSKEGVVRLLMRRDQVHKVCCNQRLSSGIQLEPLKTNNKAWTWSNQDYSEGKVMNELLCVRFKTIEQAKMFKKAFDSAVSSLSNQPMSEASSTKAVENKEKPSLAEQFKRDPSTWECQMCYVVNAKDAETCVACLLNKDGSAPTKPAAAAGMFTSFNATTNGDTKVKTEFTFGVPSAAAATVTAAPTPAAVFSFGSSDPSKPAVSSAPMVFSFGTNTNLTSSANTSMFNFGNSIAPTTSSTASAAVFSFGSGSSSSKAVSGGTLFGNSYASENKASEASSPKSQSGSSLFAGENKSSEKTWALFKDNQNVSIFSGSPIKPTEHTSIFSSFSFGQSPSFTFSSKNLVNEVSNQGVKLYKQVPLLISDENDKLLLKTPAKLYVYKLGEWRDRGVGRLQVLKNDKLDKLRLLMFREPAGVVACLNHYLQNGVEFIAYDQRSWIWSADDFSEGEIMDEKFGVIFESEYSAKEFKKVLENVNNSKASSEKSSEDEVEFVSETQTSEEDKKLAESLKLPPNFFTYKYSNRVCPGCEGCDSEDSENKSNADVPSKLQEPSDKPSSTDLKFMNKPSFVFGASDDSSLKKGSFSYSNIFNNTSNKDTPNTSTTERTDEEEGSDDEKVPPNENDPYFESVIPLPDIVEIKTGEEEEEILFQERSKIFRYDEEKKEWKERGVGDLKILHHPSQNTFRLLLRREQIHKIVLNQRITTSLNLQPLSTSKNSCCWFGMNLPEESNTPILEKLAARFKTEEIMNKFQEIVASCLAQLNDSQASRLVNYSHENEDYSSKQENIAGDDTEGNYYYDDDEEYSVEEQNGYRDFIDEQGIEDAMQDEGHVDYYTVFESSTIFQVLEEDNVANYTGVVKVVTSFHSKSMKPSSFVKFSTSDVPSLYEMEVRETVAVHEGDCVTFPLSSDSESDSKVIFRFENEAVAKRFYDIYSKTKYNFEDYA